MSPTDGDARLISATIAGPVAAASAARKPRRSPRRASARSRSASSGSRASSAARTAAFAAYNFESMSIYVTTVTGEASARSASSAACARPVSTDVRARAMPS